MTFKSWVRAYAPLLVAGAMTVISPSSGSAAIKVDINNSGRPVTEGLAAGYTPWSTNTTWFAGGDTMSATFDGVTVMFTRTGPVGTALTPNYWKAGVQDTTIDAKLTGDGIKVNTDGAVQIEMRLSGLSAGPHTLLTYHSVWDNITNNAPRLHVFLNGTQVITNLQQSVRATNNLGAACSYVSFEAVTNQDVVVLFQVNTSVPANVFNVYINGFEIDTPDLKYSANSPSPANGDEHVDADSRSLRLAWTPASMGVTNDIYIGTDSNTVFNATHASPAWRGMQTATNAGFFLTDVNSLRTYFWRVDTIDASGSVTRGTLWYFRPRHLAFPGAEGYGRFARGGRGGVVVEVTNTNDSGPGSFRDAIEGNYGPRTVVFAVSGQIILGDDVIISGSTPPITVAGQTAPGKGICFRRQQFALSGARDAIVRHVRIRVGKESGETQNGTGMAGVDHTIMDHCSISWGIDEELSTRGAKNLTFQRCHISEALNVAGHQNYPAGTAHGYAASIGGDIASFHHNLLAHCEGRNWSLAGGLDGAGYYAGRLDIFNNVVYNWGGRTTDGGAHEVNFVGNYYKPGGASRIYTALNPAYGGFPGTQQYYMTGNVMPGHFTTANQLTGTDIGTENGGTLPENSTPPYSAWVPNAFFPSYATIDEVTNAYKKVLSDVGCTQPVVDDHDIRVIRETIDGTYTYAGSVSGKVGLPDTTADVGGWEDYGTVTRPSNWDTDHDGMPDWWEVIKGFNTNSTMGNFTESNSDLDGDGYTALEDYLNWMAAPHTDCAAGSSVNIDLDALSRGYTNATHVYGFSGAVNGGVSLVSNRFARFTPSTSANALGTFNFTVTNSSRGYSMTRAVNIRVLGSGTGTSTPPATPTGLNATAGDAQVSLGWDAATEATGYILKRSVVSGGPFTAIVTNASTSYNDTGLVNGTTHYYVVSAVNTYGESANSAQVSATPAGMDVTRLFAYEGFSYTQGSWLASQSGGTGWSGAWQTKNVVATNVATGLSYGNLVTSGGSVQVGYPQPGVPGGSISSAPQRILPTTLGTMAATNDGVLWISFLMFNPPYPTVPGKYYRYANLGMYSGASGTQTTGSEVANMGMPATSATVTTNMAAWGGTVTIGAPNMSTVPGFSTNVYLVLVKLVVDNTTATDTYYAWFNPGVASLGNNAGTPDISTASVTNSGANLSSVNALRLTAGNYNTTATNAFFTADELRLGATFADVTPVTAAATSNNAPVLASISNRTINVGTVLSITNSATDADSAQTLAWSLPVKPTNATIHATSGVLTWRAGVGQANTTNAFSVVVMDNGTPSLGATQSFTVVVNPLQVPQVSMPHKSAGLIGLSISGQVGPDYLVQSSSNLVDWTTILTTNPATMPFVWTNSTGSLSSEYFRIKVQ